MTVEVVSSDAGAAAAAWLAAVFASPRQIVAHLGAAVGIVLVLAGAFVRTMIPLRWLAVGSNTGLLVYGALHPSTLTLLIAALLLPLSVYRAVEVTRLSHRVNRAEVDADLAELWLKPYMKTRRLKAGQTLFCKGDRASRLYLLVHGRMELADIGQPLETGRIFGEIALFSPSRIRTHTARCVTACTVLEIEESTVRQLYFQNPAFGFHLIDLLARRLSSDVERAEQRRGSARGDAADASAGL